MKKFLILFALPLAFLFSGKAAAIGMEISYAQYMTANNESYLELFFALDGSSLALNSTDNGSYYGGVLVTVMFKEGEEIKMADKFRILSPYVKDSNKVSGILLQQERFLLPAGTYELQIELADVKTPEEKLQLTQPIIIEDKSQKINSSDLLFLNSYKPADKNSKYSKSGYELIPIVSSGNYYFSEKMDQLSFYIELYNTDKAVGEGSTYLIKYYLTGEDGKTPLNKYASHARKKGSTIEPLLAAFNIEDLPTGNYNMVVEALDKDGEKIFRKRIFFFRKNERVEIDVTRLDQNEIAGTFVNQLGNFDSLYTFIHYLFPISTQSQRNYQKSLREERDLQKMKQYFYAFWLNEAPNNPREAWNKYHKQVKIANKLYGTRIQKGFLTPRGRVYLIYGEPSLVEQRKFEPGLPPYEMWRYDQINSKYAVNQTNKIFIFAEFDASTNDYQLIHSTAYGELNNRRWQYDLAQGNYGTGDDIDQNRIDSGDDFGSRLNNNVIMQSGNSQINR